MKAKLVSKLFHKTIKKIGCFEKLDAWNMSASGVDIKRNDQTCPGIHRMTWLVDERKKKGADGINGDPCKDITRRWVGKKMGLFDNHRNLFIPFHWQEGHALTGIWAAATLASGHFFVPLFLLQLLQSQFSIRNVFSHRKSRHPMLMQSDRLSPTPLAIHFSIDITVLLFFHFFLLLAHYSSIIFLYPEIDSAIKKAPLHPTNFPSFICIFYYLFNAFLKVWWTHLPLDGITSNLFYLLYYF